MPDPSAEPDLPPHVDYTTTEVAAGGRAAADLLGVHPSWLPLILAVLMRDDRAALDAARATAVSENAQRLLARNVADDA